MKIVSTPLRSMYSGILSAANTVSHFSMWNPEQYPVYDLFDLVKPDILFIDLKYITGMFLKAHRDYDTKIVLFGQGVPQDLFPNTVVLLPTTSPKLRKNIESDQYKTLYIDKSANVVDIFDVDTYEVRRDISYIMTDYERVSYQKQMEIIVELISGGNNIGIIGTQKMSFPYYLGRVRTQDIVRFMKEAVVVLDYDANTFLDAAANGCFCISSIQNIFYPYYKTQNLQAYSKEDREHIAKSAQTNVLQNETCYHRLSNIFDSINEQDLSNKCREKVKEICNLALL